MAAHRATNPLTGFRRARALLAGALVLGVGGSMTLASWTDTEYAAGSFSAGVFAIESTVANPYSEVGPWTVNETAPGATLAFDAGGMYPGRTVYAPLALRTQIRSVAGTATLGGAAVTNSTTTAPLLGAALVYRVVRSATCGAAAFGTGAAFVVGSATASQPLTTAQNAGVVNTLPAATETAPGSTVNFCFEVTLPNGASNSLQGKSATAVWLFSATSTP
jgi:predicted ribosomally synthesized peptide with SipW-like signal peptide